MNVSADILKMLYQQGLSSINANSTVNSGQSSSSSGVSTFSVILQDVISKGISNDLTATSTDEDSLNNSDSSLILSLLMQQIAGNSLAGQYQYYDMLNSLENSSGTSIDALSGISNSLDLTSLGSGLSEVDRLIEALQQGNMTQDNNTESVVNTVNNTRRSFPTEIMESINAARQAREQVRERINQIKEFTGRVNEGQASAISNVDQTSNIEELLANANIQNLKLTLVSAYNLNNDSSAALVAEKANESLLDKGLMPIEQSLLSTEEDQNTSDDKFRVDIIDESILDTNVLGTSNTQANNNADKLSDDIALKESVFEQIKDKVSTMKLGDKQTVTMHLKPEELGKLDIKMVLEKGNLSIEILTSNEKAHSLILSNLSELESILKDNITSDRYFMNMESARQLSDENARQNNQGYNGQQSQQQQDDSKNEQEQVYSIGSEDNERLDFYTAFSKIREARAQILSRNLEN